MSSNQRVVIHVTSDESSDWRMALRNLANLVRDDSVSTPPSMMQLVVNGPAVRFLLASAPEADRVGTMIDNGVAVCACENSLDRFGHDAAALAEGVETIPSGVAEVVRTQHRGANYLKLP